MAESMNVESFGMDGVVCLTPRVFEDDRGHFFEAWNERTFREATGFVGTFVQDNQSRSVRGVLRGLHYQIAPHAQGKLVRVLEGHIWDVAVDLRRSSPTLGRWVGVDLTDSNRRQLWIPPGFAHGFCVLSDTADVMYKTTEFYAPESDRTIRWDDADLGIQWPLDAPPLLSPKDQGAPLLREVELFD